MVSDRKLAANRSNARRSTGPRTPAGVARAARNAMRHGLAIPLARDPVACAEVERLAAALVGRYLSPARLDQARIAAEAEFELRRVRVCRKALLDWKAAELAAHEPDEDQRSEPLVLDGRYEASALAAALPELQALERYERRAASRRKRAMRWLMYTTATTNG